MSPTLRRVAVTGLGVVSAIGSNESTFWESLREGRHGIRPITLADAGSLQFRNGAEAVGVDLDSSFDAPTRELLDRFAGLWMLAARQAIESSGLPRSRFREAATVTGTSLGGQTTQDELFHHLYKDGKRRITPFAVPRIMANAGASRLSMEVGIEGPGLTLSTACSSSTHAIGIAYWMVAHGAAPLAVAGGSEAPFSLGHLKAWDSLRVVSPGLCRPFSRGRKGLVLGEGGGALVLEPMDDAGARGAHIRGEIVGFGMSSDADHVTRPSRSGAVRAMRAALRAAGLAPQDVGYVNAHGTGTPLNDATEAAAILEVFPGGGPLVSSTKSMHGHALGASGAIEAVATLLALERRIAPPTVSFLGADPECGVRVVANEAIEARTEFALSSSFAFGGLNGVLAFRRARDA